MKPFAVLVCLCLVLSISSCGNREPAVVVETQFVFLPEAFLVPCAITPWRPGGSWLDAGKLAISRKADIETCNRRLLKAKQYQDEQRQKKP